MIRLHLIILTSFLYFELAAQEVVGKYILCFKMYWECHTSIHLDLYDDSTYKLSLIDDTSAESSKGTYSFTDSALFLKPLFTPDTIKISKYETSINQYIIDEYFEGHVYSNENIIVINEYYKPLNDFNVHLLTQEHWKSFSTNLKGGVVYSGGVADSIKIDFKDRIFTIPVLSDKSSFIRLSIKSNHKDLLYRTIGRDFILIENGKMYLDVKEEEREVERVYFRKK